MATVNIDLSEFAGNNELQRDVLTGLVLDNHQPVNLVEKAEVYGVLGDEAALGVQVAIDPAMAKSKGRVSASLVATTPRSLRLPSPRRSCGGTAARDINSTSRSG